MLYAETLGPRGQPLANPKNLHAACFLSKDSEQTASWRAFTKRHLAVLNRRNRWPSISVPAHKTSSSASPPSLPISPPMAAPAPSPPETSQNLPSRSPHPQSPVHPCHRQVRPLQVPRARSAPSNPITWSCAQGKCVPASASAISRSIQKKPAPSTPLTTNASTATNPISFPWIQKPSFQTALELLSSDRYLQ
jgi:hypothetical protein